MPQWFTERNSRVSMRSLSHSFPADVHVRVVSDCLPELSTRLTRLFLVFHLFCSPCWSHTLIYVPPEALSHALHLPFMPGSSALRTWTVHSARRGWRKPYQSPNLPYRPQSTIATQTMKILNEMNVPFACRLLGRSIEERVLVTAPISAHNVYGLGVGGATIDLDTGQKMKTSHWEVDKALYGDAFAIYTPFVWQSHHGVSVRNSIGFTIRSF